MVRPHWGQQSQGAMWVRVEEDGKAGKGRSGDMVGRKKMADPGGGRELKAVPTDRDGKESNSE